MGRGKLLGKLGRGISKSAPMLPVAIPRPPALSRLPAARMGLPRQTPLPRLPKPNSHIPSPVHRPKTIAPRGPMAGPKPSPRVRPSNVQRTAALTAPPASSPKSSGNDAWNKVKNFKLAQSVRKHPGRYGLAGGAAIAATAAMNNSGAGSPSTGPNEARGVYGF